MNGLTVRRKVDHFRPDMGFDSFPLGSGSVFSPLQQIGALGQRFAVVP
jgi:hypothetical protein